MVRVACQICGAEILPETAERNRGLCGRCAKGHRPCIHCGHHVSEPLKDGTYAHVECWIRHRQSQESFGWKRVQDIDWDAIRQLLRGAATRLFQRVAPNDQGSATVRAMFYISVQDSVEIAVQEVEPDGDPKRRLSDSVWDSELSPLDSSFSRMYETLSEQDAFEAADMMEQNLMRIISDIGNELAEHNFYFPKHVQVSWTSKSA